MEVFLFFSLRPSHTREAFTYGSEAENGEGGGGRGRWEGKESRWWEKEEGEAWRGAEEERGGESQREAGGGSRENKIRGDSCEGC